MPACPMPGAPPSAPAAMAASPSSCSISAADFARDELRAEPREMPADDVAAFMGDDADHLVWRLGLHQRAGMDEHIVPVDDEGVEAAVVDDVNFDGLRAQPRSVEDRLGVGADQSLGLGIADHPGGIGRRRADKDGGKSADQARANVPARSIEGRLSQEKHGRLIV